MKSNSVNNSFNENIDIKHYFKIKKKKGKNIKKRKINNNINNNSTTKFNKKNSFTLITSDSNNLIRPYNSFNTEKTKINFKKHNKYFQIINNNSTRNNIKNKLNNNNRKIEPKTSYNYLRKKK